MKRGQDKETKNGSGGDGIDYDDPDPTEDFPQWSKTIILLLDYAMIEGIRRGMHMFVHLLDAARVELQTQVAESAAEADRQERESKAAVERRRRSVS